MAGATATATCLGGSGEPRDDVISVLHGGHGVGSCETERDGEEGDRDGLHDAESACERRDEEEFSVVYPWPAGKR